MSNLQPCTLRKCLISDINIQELLEQTKCLLNASISLHKSGRLQSETGVMITPATLLCRKMSPGSNWLTPRTVGWFWLAVAHQIALRGIRTNVDPRWRWCHRPLELHRFIVTVTVLVRFIFNLIDLIFVLRRNLNNKSVILPGSAPQNLKPSSLHSLCIISAAWSYFQMLMEGLPPPTVATPTSQTLRDAERLVSKATGLWQLSVSHWLTDNFSTLFSPFFSPLYSHTVSSVSLLHRFILSFHPSFLPSPCFHLTHLFFIFNVSPSIFSSLESLSLPRYYHPLSLTLPSLLFLYFYFNFFSPLVLFLPPSLHLSISLPLGWSRSKNKSLSDADWLEALRTPVVGDRERERKRATEKQKKGGKRRKEVIKMEGCRGFADVEGRMEEMVIVRILNMLSYRTA